MLDTHRYVPQCINRGNGHVTNDHLQAKNSWVSRALDTFCVMSSPRLSRHELKSKLNLYFLPYTLAARLCSSFAFSFCKLQLSYLQIYFKAYELLWTDVLSAAHWWQILHGSSLVPPVFSRRAIRDWFVLTRWCHYTWQINWLAR